MKKIALLFISLLLVSRAFDLSTRSHDFLSAELLTKPQVELELRQGTLYPAVANMYNVFIGNPLEPSDPGFQTFEVFKLNWASTTTSDARFRVPKEFYVRDFLDCKSDVTSETITGMQSYKKSLQQVCKLDVEYDNAVNSASFQGSVDYQSRKEGLDKKETISTIRKLSCKTYIVSLNDNIDMEINPILAKQMKKYHAQDNWEGFINKYGTHYVYKAIYGAMALEETSFSKTDADKLSSMGLDISVDIKGKTPLLKAGVSSDTKYTDEQRDVMGSVKSKSESWVVGIAPDADKPDNFNAWIDKVQKGSLVAQPVQYFLKNLQDVFDTDYWPQSLAEPKEVNDMRAGFTAALLKIASKFPPVPQDLKLGTTIAASVTAQINFGKSFTTETPQEWYSPSRDYLLAWQRDGNLVLYYKSTVIWSSDTYGKAKYLRLRDDGKMDILGEAQNSLWNADAGSVGDGKTNYLAVQDDGNVVIYDRNKQARWATGTDGKTTGRSPNGSSADYVKDYFNPQEWTSPDGQKTLKWQADGNLVVYCGTRPIWSSHTNGSGYRLALQKDGNMVVYGKPSSGENYRPLFASMTNQGSSDGWQLRIQNDGNAVIYDRNNKPKWASGKFC